jgi:hypothetical protein
MGENSPHLATLPLSIGLWLIFVWQFQNPFVVCLFLTEADFVETSVFKVTLDKVTPHKKMTHSRHVRPIRDMQRRSEKADKTFKE